MNRYSREIHRLSCNVCIRSFNGIHSMPSMRMGCCRRPECSLPCTLHFNVSERQESTITGKIQLHSRSIHRNSTIEMTFQKLSHTIQMPHGIRFSSPHFPRKRLRRYCALNLKNFNGFFYWPLRTHFVRDIHLPN